MKRNLMTAAALVLVGVSLSACNLFGGKKSSSPVATVTTPPVAAKFEAQFGPGFEAAYGASAATSEPRDAAAGDVIPVNPTAEPVSLPGT